MANSQILILGSRGMVGSAIAGAAGERAILATRSPISTGTLTFDALTDNLTPVLEKIKNPPKAVVIAFGISGVHTCATDPIKSYKLNVDRVLSVARAAAEFGALPVIFSTDSVFDGTAKLWTEDDRPEPINEYGRQKLIAENEIAKAGIPFLTMRLSRVIADHARHRDMLYDWCDHISRNLPIKLPTDLHFTPIAAFDLGHIAIELIDANVRGLVHVAGPRQISSPVLLDMLRKECKKAGVDYDFPVEPCRVEDLPGIDKRLANTMLSIDRLKHLISPKFQSLEETVKIVVATAFKPGFANFSSAQFK